MFIHAYAHFYTHTYTRDIISLFFFYFLYTLSVYRRFLYRRWERSCLINVPCGYIYLFACRVGGLLPWFILRRTRWLHSSRPIPLRRLALRASLERGEAWLSFKDKTRVSSIKRSDLQDCRDSSFFGGETVEDCNHRVSCCVLYIFFFIGLTGIFGIYRSSWRFLCRNS